MKGGLYFFLFLACLLFAAPQRSTAQSAPKSAHSIHIRSLDSLVTARKAPLILNFWATFCKPCIEEIPIFEQMVDSLKASGLELWLVSLDMEELYPKVLAEFSTKKGFRSKQFWLNETNADYFCPFIDPKWSGAIPASLFINPATGYRRFYEQALSPTELNQAIKAMLGKSTTH